MKILRINGSIIYQDLTNHPKQPRKLWGVVFIARYIHNVSLVRNDFVLFVFTWFFYAERNFLRVMHLENAKMIIGNKSTIEVYFATISRPAKSVEKSSLPNHVMAICGVSKILV